MAKVMVSMPDELLAEVDADAERTGSTRSAVLRGYAEDAIRRRRMKRAAGMKDLLDRHSGSYGGSSAEAIKAARPDVTRYLRKR
jgi:predicted transcriptional regulator